VDATWRLRLVTDGGPHEFGFGCGEIVGAATRLDRTESVGDRRECVGAETTGS
jgi:hypothetical protein